MIVGWCRVAFVICGAGSNGTEIVALTLQLGGR